MTIKVNGKGRTLFLTQRGIWTLFAVFVIALTISAAVGTTAVQASGSCTSDECASARVYADTRCGNLGLMVTAFVCPVPSQTDDFFFQCGSGVFSHQEKD